MSISDAISPSECAQVVMDIGEPVTMQLQGQADTPMHALVREDYVTANDDSPHEFVTLESTLQIAEASLPAGVTLRALYKNAATFTLHDRGGREVTVADARPAGLGLIDVVCR